MGHISAVFLIEAVSNNPDSLTEKSIDVSDRERILRDAEKLDTRLLETST